MEILSLLPSHLNVEYAISLTTTKGRGHFFYISISSVSTLAYSLSCVSFQQRNAYGSFCFDVELRMTISWFLIYFFPVKIQNSIHIYNVCMFVDSEVKKNDWYLSTRCLFYNVVDRAENIIMPFGFLCCWEIQFKLHTH